MPSSFGVGLAGAFDQYAGIVLNQNTPPTGWLPWRAAYANAWIYQTFALPTDFLRGATRSPDLAGFQVLVAIDAGQAANAALTYTLQYFDGGWNTLTSGSVTGAHADGAAVWMDVYFPQSIPISPTIFTAISKWRIGLQVTSTSPISQVGYVAPNPLASGQAFAGDGVTPLLGTPAALNFRVLALSADSGIDFLGNEYRSCVVGYSPQNTDTADSHTQAFWMSPPRPSRFAVESMYFDMRPLPTTPQYGNINLITNPSFEYDALGSKPAGWAPFGPATLTVTTGAGTSVGQQACQSQGTTNTISHVLGWQFPGPTPVTAGQTYQFIATVNVASNQLTNGMSAYITWLRADRTTKVTDSSGATIVSTVDAWSSLGLRQINNSVVAPATAAYAQIFIGASGNASGLSFQGWLDAVAFFQSTTTGGYFDGDAFGATWLGQPGFAASAQMVDAEPNDNLVVIDGVLLDPITPNVTMSVYYSLDDANNSDNMSESDWEGKLWTRVPQSFTLNQRKQYMFPAPVQAKYMKLEFSNLQSRAYTPTDFQKPMSYKRFPAWVLDYFIAQMELPSFTAQQVNVQYDALALAYQYYLDDLGSTPAMPSVAALQSSLTSYFNAAPSGIDATTLKQINLDLRPFAQTLGLNVDSSTQLGAFVSNLFSSNTLPQVVEGGGLPSLSFPAISPQAVVEQTLPPMYFFLTTRHSYQTLSATFSQHRAYFVGVNDVAFVRHNYGVASDTPLYIETNGDLTNTDLSDFALDPNSGIWYVS